MSIHRVGHPIPHPIEEIRDSTIKGIIIGNSIGAGLAVYFFLKRHEICLWSRPEASAVCYVNLTLTSYALVPICTVAGLAAGTTYGVFKQVFCKK